MNEPFLIYAIGFLAQIFFSARTLLQWIKSEKVKAVVSPSSYWILSISGSYLLCLYGWFREDFSIILGQFLSYYILNERSFFMFKEKGAIGNTPMIKLSYEFEGKENYVYIKLEYYNLTRKYKR